MSGVGGGEACGMIGVHIDLMIVGNRWMISGRESACELSQYPGWALTCQPLTCPRVTQTLPRLGGQFSPGWLIGGVGAEWRVGEHPNEFHQHVSHERRK